MPRFRPQLCALVAFVRTKIEVSAVYHRMTGDEKRPQIHFVNGAVVVVCCASILSTNRDSATVEGNHSARVDRTPREGYRERRVVWLALFQLQCLKNGLVVLVLVLKDHVVDVTALEERIVVVPLEPIETVENAHANLLQSRHHLRQRWKRQRCTRCAWMLKRVV